MMQVDTCHHRDRSSKLHSGLIATKTAGVFPKILFFFLITLLNYYLIYTHVQHEAALAYKLNYKCMFI